MHVRACLRACVHPCCYSLLAVCRLAAEGGAERGVTQTWAGGRARRSTHRVRRGARLPEGHSTVPRSTGREARVCVALRCAALRCAARDRRIGFGECESGSRQWRDGRGQVGWEGRWVRTLPGRRTRASERPARWSAVSRWTAQPCNARVHCSHMPRVNARAPGLSLPSHGTGKLQRRVDGIRDRMPWRAERLACEGVSSGYCCSDTGCARPIGCRAPA
jgi:hypothetical protein